MDGEKEKPKGKPKSRWRVFPVLLILNIMGIIAGLMLLGYFRSLVVSIPDGLMPTAEYLDHYAYAQPTSDFVQFHGFGNPPCFDVGGADLWEPQDGSNSLTAKVIASRTRLIIDGQPFTMDEVSWTDPMVADPVIENVEGYQEGTRVRAYVGVVHVCLNRMSLKRDGQGPRLASGLHIITVEMTTTSGVVHSYSWSFRVP